MDNASGRVQVFARVRPPTEQEVGFVVAVDTNEAARAVRVRNDGDAVERLLGGQADDSRPGSEAREFIFDGVFSQDSAQRDVFMQMGLPVLRDSLKGINGTILAYGQTGSGKTFSLLNQTQRGEEAGLLPRLVASLFVHVAQDSANVYDIDAAALQVYNEQVDDLLHPDHQSGTGNNLVVRDGGAVPTLTWVNCQTPEQMLEAFTRARANVIYAETRMNKASSRSHAVFQLKITKRQRATASMGSGGTQRMECTLARLNVVDLAGSERIKKSGSEGMRFQEATCINKSLLHFGNVVSALAAKKSHVPLRDSKLTRILEGSIGGNCKTALLVCVSPAAENVSETVNTFEFASRAMRVEVDAKVNRGIIEVSAKQLLADLSSDLRLGGIGGPELEELRKRSREAAEQAQFEAKRREQAVAEAEKQARKLQQQAQEAEVRGRQWKEEADSLRQSQQAASDEAEQLRQEVEKAQQKEALYQATSAAQAKEVEVLRLAAEKAQRTADEWRVAAEARAKEVSLVKEVIVKKEAVEVVRVKEEVFKAEQQTATAKKDAEQAKQKAKAAEQEVAKAEQKVREAEQRILAAEKVAADLQGRATAAEAATAAANIEAMKQEALAEEQIAAERRAAAVKLEEAAREAELLRLNCEEGVEREAALQAELLSKTQELEARTAALMEAQAALQAFQKEAAEREERLRAEHLAELEEAHRLHAEEMVNLRAEMELALQCAQQGFEQEQERWRGEAAAIEVVMEHKAALWEQERLEISAEHAAAIDSQREEFQEQLQHGRDLLEAKLAEIEAAAQQERESLNVQMEELKAEKVQRESLLKEEKEEALKEAWEGGNAQQRKLAAAFKAARNLSQMKEQQLQEQHSDLSKRFAARESREEDVHQIASQRQRLAEQQKNLHWKNSEVETLARELRNRDECDRIFGSAGMRRPRAPSPHRPYVPPVLPGRKLGETVEFGERARRRVLSGNHSTSDSPAHTSARFGQSSKNWAPAVY